MTPADDNPEYDPITPDSGAVARGVEGVIPEDDAVIGELPFEPCGNLPEPVVPLTGWVRKLDLPGTAARLRLYIDPCFEEWLEIPVKDVATFINGNSRLSDDGQSKIWVKADTTVTNWTVRTAKASFFARRELERRGFDEPPPTGGYGGPKSPPGG
ncbi:MAG: hypothetical protein ACRDLN_00610 [Solirubrobacteraceae bacterium]